MGVVGGVVIESGLKFCYLVDVFFDWVNGWIDSVVEDYCLYMSIELF